MPRHLNETQTIRPTTELTDLFRQAAGRAYGFQAPATGDGGRGTTGKARLQAVPRPVPAGEG